MATTQIRSTSGSDASTSYGADGDLADMGFMCGTTHIEASAAVTRAVGKALEPRGATVELDPQRGEAHRQMKLPQSFTLTDMARTTPMNPIHTSKQTKKVTELGNGASALMEIATSVVNRPLFSASYVLNMGVKPSEVFKLATTLCEDTQDITSSTEVRHVEGAAEAISSTSSGETWHAAAARLVDLSARPAFERTRFKPSVVSLDNWAGIFRLIGPSGVVY
jgi:hypothetical protein